MVRIFHKKPQKTQKKTCMVRQMTQKIFHKKPQKMQRRKMQMMPGFCGLLSLRRGRG